MLSLVKTFSELETTISSTPRLVVDYSASWCAPCKRILPIIEQLAQDNPNITFLKVDVEDVECQGINALPTFEFYRSGSLQHTVQGANAEEVKQAVLALLKDGQLLQEDILNWEAQS